MKIAGLIAEFNPLHLGHEYLIEKIKEDDVDLIICTMSPNFTMRGELSILSKMDKTKIALEKGVDIVAEIPTIYTIESADNYAHKALEILNSLKVTDLYFGAEIEDTQKYYQIIDVRKKEEYKSLLNKYRDMGYSLKDASKRSIITIDSSFKDLLESPNSLLALEYIESIKENNYNITPHIIKRIETNYFDEIKNGVLIQSASAIRKEYFINKESKGLSYNLSDYKTYDIRDYFDLIKYKITSSSLDELKKIKGVNEGIENLLKKNAYINNYDDFVSSLISKRNRETKIKRILMYILLNIKKDEFQDDSFNPIRILGVREKGRKYLKIFSPEMFTINIKKDSPEFIKREIDFSKIYYKNDELKVKSEYHPVILD